MEGVQHWTFTRNNIPRIEREVGGDPTNKFFLSPENILTGHNQVFSLKHLVAFGTAATCYIDPSQRKEKKTPGQKKSLDGVIIGYVVDSPAYRIYDIEKRKIREISYNF